MPLDTWLAFVLLWTAIALAPGPSVAYALSVGSRRGAGAAVCVAAGYAAAVACYVTMVAFGLINFLAASAELFEVLRWIGVTYLFYLAWRSWRAPTDVEVPPAVDRRAAGGFAVRAVLVALTNPKAAMYYVMMYPLFVSTAGDAIAQFVVLGATTVAIEFMVYAGYGLAAGRLGRLVRTARQARLRNRAFAAAFASAGVALAWAGRR